MVIEEYFNAQKENLRRVLYWQPFTEIFSLVDKLYNDAIELVPGDHSPVYGQFLLICHKSFLTAASLIGQAQSDDAVLITRRAIEVARFAVTVKTDPEKTKEWMAFRERMEQWADRQEGKKPKFLKMDYGDVHPGIKPAVNDLMQTHGILSFVAAHFTPEYFHELDWERLEEKLNFNYFAKEQRVLGQNIVLTSGTHLRILEVIDWCLDGAFKADPDWLNLVATLKEKEGNWPQNSTALTRMRD